jgi:hypothetical protein
VEFESTILQEHFRWMLRARDQERDATPNPAFAAFAHSKETVLCGASRPPRVNQPQAAPQMQPPITFRTFDD